MKMIVNKIKDLGRKFDCILSKKHKRQGIWVLVLITVGALFESLGVSAIVPFIESMMSPEEMMQNKYIQLLSEVITIDSSQKLIFVMAVGIIVIYIVKNVYLAISGYIKIKYQNQVQKDLSVFLMNSYLRRPYTFFLEANSGEITRGLTNDVTGVYGILDNILKTLSEGMATLFIVIYIIFSDPMMALGIMILAGGSLLAIVLAFRKRLKIMGKEQWLAMKIRYQCANQVIGGIKDIKVMKRERAFAKTYEAAHERQRIADTNYFFAGICPERIIETVCICGLIGMICFRMAVGVDMESFIPKLAGFAMAAFRILPSMSRMAGSINSVVYYTPALESTYKNVVAAKEYKESIEEGMIEKVEEKSELNFENELILQNVDWSYPNSPKQILNNLCLGIKKGQAIALIGASGAGKTTLADIILGLLHPQKGMVSIDGVDVFSQKNRWSRMIGYVPQTVFLIDDTIRNNVLFGCEDADDEKIWAVLEKAQLKKFVEELPDGLDTVVGERGIKFSGGQRQRIAIARALYYDPEILVLDEATSALDTDTEDAIMEAIDALSGYKTLIIVAHRLSTIRNCDVIYEITNGKAERRDKNVVLNKETKI